MNKMKKMLSLLMAAALVLTVKIPVLADESEGGDGESASKVTSETLSEWTENDSSSKVVTVYVSGANNVDTVYYVVLDWESLDFTYTFTANAATWQPTTHTYGENSTENTDNWDKTSAKITVTNHSNAAVDVEASFTKEEGKPAVTSVTTNAVTATLSASDDDPLDSAEGIDEYNNADSKTITVSVKGIPNTTKEKFTVDTVTVTLSKVAAADSTTEGEQQQTGSDTQTQ